MTALTLADSFLNDLDELEEESVDKDSKVADREEELCSKPSVVLEERVSLLRESERYCQHMRSILNFMSRTNDVVAEEGNKEYEIIVESNEVLSKIDEESNRVHRLLVEKYSHKFPELETLVPEKLDYAKVVLRIRNQMDMTQIELNDILPPTSVMVISVTGSTTSGAPLAHDVLQKCIDDCNEIIGLDNDRIMILNYLESRMAKIAPNTTELIGAALTAMLIGTAGGLEKLAAIPACNLTCLGQHKYRDLAGFGNQATMPHTGILYYADLVQAAPPPLRRKILKIVAAKTTLCARVDAHSNSLTDTSAAQAMVQEIKSKIELLCAPQKAQQVKALPAPDIATSKSKRGGKRVRKAKDKLRITELRGLANKRAFGTDFGTEYGDDAMGNDFGLMGQEGAGVRAPAQQKSSLSLHNKNKKQRTSIQLSSSAPSGLASSLVFTPVQGIELAANPASQQAKLDAANAKWFNSSSGFQSALATNKNEGGLTF